MLRIIQAMLVFRGAREQCSLPCLFAGVALVARDMFELVVAVGARRRMTLTTYDFPQLVPGEVMGEVSNNAWHQECVADLAQEPYTTHRARANTVMGEASAAYTGL